MSRLVPFVPSAVVAALLLVPSSQASHLSMEMPGLGGAVVPPPSFVLLVAAALAALLQGAWLLRRTEAARDAGWVLALVPLAVSAAHTSSLSPSGPLDARIAAVGRAGSEHLWALLATLALVVGYGAARTLEGALAWRASQGPEAPRVLRSVAALVLTGPFVALVLTTSTGVDWISSWIRWGGCGLGAVACAVGALVPRRGDVRVLGGITFALAVVLGLLAEREYVEALGHDALVRRDPFDPAVGWVPGLREIAAAVEPRERYGVVAALLPWLALAPGSVRRHAAIPLAAGLALLVAVVVASTGISSRLDTTALAAAPVAALATETTGEDEDEILWSVRVLPRTAPWLRAMRRRPDVHPPSVAPVRCAAWSVTAAPASTRRSLRAPQW